ncbi:MAG TPA: MmcQ/YjbR family DNA-binding protein [Eubacteriales bacterium]|jgi:predicted DNA-binding protein (MmcQ/YjbR family)|nr:MmcQ/YjbR family DNA-binding protein [Clostridia bacterium]HRV73192.1 MmcQ/YjbR family DNA-binding protein [Eubacteriales bacterium]
MGYDWLDGYLLSKPEAVKDFKAEWGWFRYMLRDKMFAAVCTPDMKYHPSYGGRTLVNLKCEPELAELFRAQYPDLTAGFYMDKKHWNCVFLDGDVPDDVMRFLCDMSYDLVLHGLTKKAQREIAENAAKAQET